LITSLTIGTGIDYAIHATQRFRVTADRTGDIEKAVSKTIGHTGGALFIAAITTVAGFGMLILAPMPPEQQFGIITVNDHYLRIYKFNYCIATDFNEMG